MGPERVIWTKFKELIFDEGWNPEWISMIDLPRQPDEGDEIPFIPYFFNKKSLCWHSIDFRQMTPSCFPTFSKAFKTSSNCSSVWVAI